METKQLLGFVHMRMLVLVAICLMISTWLCCIEAAATADEEVALKSKKCVKGLTECKNKTISEIFTVDQFESLFSHRNAPMAHAQGFWDYHSFITAAAHFEPKGFGTTGGDLVQKKELAAFFAHVATETSCESLMAQSSTAASDDSPTKWGLCYKEELSPDSTYCESSLVYPCSPGVSYHGRGALPVYWNYNYGQLGHALKVDLLHHAEYLSENASLAFSAAIWKWMNPVKVKQPSAHQVIVGKYVPTKNDTNALRLPGFGMTINILKGEAECGTGSDDKQMSKRIAHYLYFLDKLDVGRENSGDNLDCSDQKVLNPSSSAST